MKCGFAVFFQFREQGEARLPLAPIIKLKQIKKGIWMKDLARKLDISRPLLNHYLFGMKKNSELVGGNFRSKIILRKEGNNRFISMKANQD